MAVLSRPSTIPQVIERMRALEASLPRADGVAWFTRLYLRVTETVHVAVKPHGFRDPRFLARLDVEFANLFFDAVAKPPKAWAPLFEARSRKGIAPIQFALAGMNAHINRDLPVAVVSTCEHLGIDLERSPKQHSDYVAVNPLLEKTERKVKQWFATGFVGVVDVVCGDDDDRIAMWDVCRARDAAWVQARALWVLRGVPPLRRAYVDTLDRSVGFAGRGLLLTRET
ncbi:MAG: hypothetical protein E6G08_16930 [Actinobacteria bacterium]|nr:MAG: hypothetical protein E6G08_16930 [Actinomycetota bacterium]